MADAVGARKRLVQTLRGLAKHCSDVRAVRDDVGKGKVEQLAKELSKSSRPPPLAGEKVSWPLPVGRGSGLWPKSKY